MFWNVKGRRRGYEDDNIKGGFCEERWAGLKWITCKCSSATLP